MANREFNPNEQYCDSTGTPYAGGTLDFFASGTNTRLATYQDQGLTSPNTNPVVLDSAGRAGNIFLQNLSYKVVLKDVNANQIWTADPAYASDFSSIAQIITIAGSPNGNLAGTAGSGSIPSSMAWDRTNNILYVCTVTGSSSTATWTAVNASTAAAVVPTPQGYLTPTSNTPIILSDVIAATSLVYTPYQGNLVPIYTGTGFNPTVFSELLLTLTAASHVSSSIYDVFVFSNSGVLTLATGPAWTTITAGACARGTGASTTQLSLINGIYVNTVSMTGKNNLNTFTIGANLATYLGSIFIDSAAGQITLHRSYGQSRKWAIWNAYNRVPIFLKAGEPANYNVNVIAFRPSSGHATNNISIFTGLAEEWFDLRFQQEISMSFVTISSPVGNASIGIGVNSTTTTSGMIGNTVYNDGNTASHTASTAALVSAEFMKLPALGLNVIQSLESVATNSGTITYGGSEASMLLTASYRG